MSKQPISEQATDDQTMDSRRFKWPPELARGHLQICVEEKKKGNWQSNHDHNLEDLDGSFFGSEAYSMNKEMLKIRDKFHTVGYRDGITAGQEAAAQEGYNVGYKESVLAGYKFGVVRGVSSALAFLPDELKEKLIDDQETKGKFQKLHDSVHHVSTEAAMKLFYTTINQREDKSGPHASGSASATTDLGNHVTELRSLLDKSPKIKVKFGHIDEEKSGPKCWENTETRQQRSGI